MREFYRKVNCRGQANFKRKLLENLMKKAEITLFIDEGKLCINVNTGVKIHRRKLGRNSQSRYLLADMVLSMISVIFPHSKTEICLPNPALLRSLAGFRWPKTLKNSQS